MTVFKTILKILNKKKGMLILYTAILISITVLNQTSGSNAVDFEDSKPDVLIVNKGIMALVSFLLIYRLYKQTFRNKRH